MNKVDNVNHPSHYETGKFECIDVMLETQGVEAVKNFCICNAFKYIYRHNGKNGDEDIRKAKWYIDKYVELSDGTEQEATKEIEKIVESVFVDNRFPIKCNQCNYRAMPSDQEPCNSCRTYSNFKPQGEIVDPYDE